MSRLPRLRIESLALPIGNYQDLGKRGADLLSSAQILFCEDSRKVKSLMDALRLSSTGKWLSIPGDEEWKFDFSKLAEGAQDGDLWVLVSDAGTPVVNDPGRALIEWGRREGMKVSAVPGPSAVTAALQWCGGFGVPFVFLGFAPKEKNPQSKNWENFFAPIAGAATVIFFDTKHQVLGTLEALSARGLADQPLFIARELSKEHEELLSGSVEELRIELETRLGKNEPLGELTLVMKGLEARATHSAVTLDQLKTLRTASTKDAAKLAAEITGLSKSDCYQAFVEDK